MRIYAIIIVAFLAFVSYGIFSEFNKTPEVSSPKAKRIACQNKVTTFEKIFEDKPVLEAVNAFKNGNYEVKADIEYSKKMKSNLTDILNVEQASKILEISIAKFVTKPQNQSDKNLIIDYYIYENDKEDDDKKNDDAKLYAGYLVFQFKYEKATVYKTQIDYMKMDASDIEERMDCVIQSFISIQ